jgi:hypothetical protein
MSAKAPSTKKTPSHPELIKVVFNPGFHTSFAESLVSLPAGALFSRIDTATAAPQPTWASVQISADKHIDLNSDLVYCNHSCAPSLEFDMMRMEVRVARDIEGGRLEVGDILTFFYPSTEWNMSRPFHCECKHSRCKGWISGSGQMKRAQLDGYWLNWHIRELLEKEDRRSGETKL